MFSLKNHSRWRAGLYSGCDKQGKPQLTCVLKASYDFNDKGELKPMSIAPPIQETDIFYKDPLTSSLAIANEVMPFKQGSEILLQGTVYPPAGARRCTVSCAIHAPRYTWKKTLYVFGKRYWKMHWLRLKSTDPELLTPLSLRYEYAFGKTAENPVGQGFVPEKKVSQRIYLPQIEIGSQLIRRARDQPPPAGFGPIPPFWRSRIKQMPLILDQPCVHGMDPPANFYNVAPPDQYLPHSVCGEELLSLSGFFAGRKMQQAITIQLPTLKPRLQWQTASSVTELQLNWDTLLVNTDKKNLHLIGRVGVPHHCEEKLLHTISIQ